MTREEKMAVFEKACADWCFDFVKDIDNPNGINYLDYHTGIMFGMFIKGFESATESVVNECVRLLPEDCKDADGVHMFCKIKEHFGVK